MNYIIENCEKNYIIVSCENPAFLEYEVAHKEKEGYVIHGNLVVKNNNLDELIYIQAMIKTEEEPNAHKEVQE